MLCLLGMLCMSTASYAADAGDARAGRHDDHERRDPGAGGDRGAAGGRSGTVPGGGSRSARLRRALRPLRRSRHQRQCGRVRQVPCDHPRRAPGGSGGAERRHGVRRGDRLPRLSGDRHQPERRDAGRGRVPAAAAPAAPTPWPSPTTGTACSAHAAHRVLATGAGDERAVAATKTYTGQLAALAAFWAAWLGDRELAAALAADVPAAMEAALATEDAARAVAARLSGADRLIVAGRGFNYATALETRSRSRRRATWRRCRSRPPTCSTGPIAMVEPRYPVLLLAPDGRTRATGCSSCRPSCGGAAPRPSWSPTLPGRAAAGPPRRRAVGHRAAAPCARGARR